MNYFKILTEPPLTPLTFLLLSVWLSQRGPGLQADLGAGEPSSSCQRLPCRGAEQGLCVPRIHLSKTQVLGQERGSWAKRHNHSGASQVKTSITSCFLTFKLCMSVVWNFRAREYSLSVSFFPRHNEAYTWTNPTCCVHNIIVGQLWIEQYGNMELLNHRYEGKDKRHTWAPY